MTEPKAKLDSGEFYDRIKARFSPFIWAGLVIAFLVPPIVWIARLPTQAETKTIVQAQAPTKEKFIKLQSRVDAWEKRIETLFQGLEKRLDRMERKIDAKGKNE